MLIDVHPMRKIRRVHFVGIGGAGMSGIAEVLHNLGYEISGSDKAANATSARLQAMGIKVYIGHDGKHVCNGSNAEVVVVSTAISADNPEVLMAREHRIPVIRRAEMLAEIMRFRYGIAIAGTHGKTTTTSLVASILLEGKLDPTYVIGGKLNSAATNAKLGTGRYLVAEADESDASFLLLQPMISVVTNIDADHLETYGGDFNRYRQTFIEFLHHLPFYGHAVMCIDDAEIRGLLDQVSRPIVTYGIDQEADIRGTNIRPQGVQTVFDVSMQGRATFEVRLNLPGRHNVLNALAAIGVAQQLGVEEAVIQNALAYFAGVGRRLQQYGEVTIPQGKVLIVDDYGHHPTEIAATISAVRDAWPGRRLVVAFQPHRYTRTRDLFEDFARVLADNEVLVLTDIYSAGEAHIAGADGRALCAAIRARGRVNPVFVDTIEELPQALCDVVQDGDVILTLGAGSIGTMPGRLLTELCA